MDDSIEEPELMLADVDSEGEPICSFCRGYGEILKPVNPPHDFRLVCEDCGDDEVARDARWREWAAWKARREAVKP